MHLLLHQYPGSFLVFPNWQFRSSGADSDALGGENVILVKRKKILTTVTCMHKTKVNTLKLLDTNGSPFQTKVSLLLKLNCHYYKMYYCSYIKHPTSATGTYCIVLLVLLLLIFCFFCLYIILSLCTNQPRLISCMWKPIWLKTYFWY